MEEVCYAMTCHATRLMIPLQIFKEVCENSGEGIILRDPRAPYLPGYSKHLYKYKVTGSHFWLVLIYMLGVSRCRSCSVA